MTNEELKKKICDIIAPYVSAYGDDERIADALIAAGIGDLKEHRIFAGKDGSIKQLYSVEEVEKIVKERKELKDELRSKVEYIHEQDEVIKEYKHRAEVAERALRYACWDLTQCYGAKVRQEWADLKAAQYKNKAEKELAEEEKDEQS